MKSQAEVSRAFAAFGLTADSVSPEDKKRVMQILGVLGWVLEIKELAGPTEEFVNGVMKDVQEIPPRPGQSKDEQIAEAVNKVNRIFSRDPSNN